MYDKDKVFIFRKNNSKKWQEGIEYSLNIKKYAKKYIKNLESQKNTILIQDINNEIFQLGKIKFINELNNGNIKIRIKIEKSLNNPSEKFKEITKKYYKELFNYHYKFFILNTEGENNKINFILEDSYLIEDIVDYLNKIDELTLDEEEYIYRGQSDAEWGLLASVFRNNYTENKEKNIYRELRKYNYDGFSRKDKKDKFLDELIDYQHYGLPTRLLDWSTNSLVALFFAVSGEKDKTGKVFAFSPDRKIDFNHDDYEKISNLLESDFFNTTNLNEYKDFLKEIYYSYKTNNNYFFIETIFNNDRIKAQQGCFSLLIDLKPKYIKIIRKEIISDIIINSDIININLSTKQIREKIIEEIIKEIVKDDKVKIRKEINERDLIKKINAIIVEYLNRSNKQKGITMKIKEDELKKVVNKIDQIFNYSLKEQNYNLKLRYQTLKFVIPSQQKNKIKSQLSKIGINSVTVYPDIQGYIQYVKEKF